jgi:hypothetical protein
LTFTAAPQGAAVLVSAFFGGFSTRVVLGRCAGAPLFLAISQLFFSEHILCGVYFF